MMQVIDILPQRWQGPASLRRYDMGTLSALLALCEWNHRWSVVSHHKGPVFWTFCVRWFFCDVGLHMIQAGQLTHWGRDKMAAIFQTRFFKCVFMNEKRWISISISLKFVPKGPINNSPALVRLVAWRRLGDKPLSEPMMVSLRTHICVTGPQWVKMSWLSCNISVLS